MTDDKQDSWNKLVDTAKHLDATGSAAEVPAPEGFVARMRSVRKSLWSLARTLLWRRWSLVAIVVAALLYLLVYLFFRPDPTPTIPTPQPPTPLAP